jgi:hypothetical protein
MTFSAHGAATIFSFRLLGIDGCLYNILCYKVLEKYNIKQFPLFSHHFSTVFKYNFNHAALVKSYLSISPEGRISTRKMDHKLFSK